MKNTMLLTALLSTLATGAWAQQPPAGIVPTGEAKVRLDMSFSPIVHIELGTGADLVTLELNKASDYEKPEPRVVENQLRVFCLGSGYEVGAAVSAPKGQEAIYKLFMVDVDTKISGLKPRVLKKPNVPDLVHSTSIPKGHEDMHAVYAIKPLNAQTAQAYRDLFGTKGGPKTFSVDVTYTIAPR